MSTTGVATAVLFDMDGVLVETEALKAEAHASTIREIGGRYHPEFYLTVMGRPQGDVVRAFIRDAGLNVDEDQYQERFRRTYVDLIRTRVRVVPGAVALLERLRGDGHRLALVSSSLRWMVDEVLARTGLRGRFDAVVTADDVCHEKPAPDPYLRALAELQLQPNRAVVLEDTDTGVESGRRAGLPVIGLRHEYNVHHELSGAVAVLASLRDAGQVVVAIERAMADPDLDP